MSYKSYYLYQKYQSIGGGTPTPVYPEEFSVDGDGTMPKVIKDENDVNCGAPSSGDTIYRWVDIPISSDYICDVCPTPSPYASQYFTTVSTYSGNGESKFTLTIPSGITTDDLVNISYSLDSGLTWTTVQNVNNQQVVVQTPNINYGEKVFWKGNGVRLGNSFISGTSIWNIGSTFRFVQSYTDTTYEVEGNIMSLLYGDNFRDKVDLTNNTWAFSHLLSGGKEIGSLQNLVLPATTLGVGCYRYLFTNCKNVSIFPKLPATTLAENCYESMFSRCERLETAPELPVTTLEANCYYQMFRNCTSLTTAPVLSATTLASGCYQSMFEGCTSLTVAPVLSATTLAVGCYGHMFSGCTSLTTAPVLSATTLADNCYQSMFEGCTSLTTAPQLPATTLEYHCYASMFEGCTSLTTAPELPATTLAERCYERMFLGCSSLISAPPTLPATTLRTSCYESMFSRCSSLTTAPIIMATTIYSQSTYVMSQMFRVCGNLNFIKCMLQGSINPTYHTPYWTDGVSSSGTFVKDASSSWSTGDSGIPSNWTVQNA